MRFALVTSVLLVTLLVTTSCGRDKGLRCVDNARYASSATAPALRIPDDLTIPDETDALRVPDESLSPEDGGEELPCLESAPDFFEDLNDD